VAVPLPEVVAAACLRLLPELLSSGREEAEEVRGAAAPSVLEELAEVAKGVAPLVLLLATEPPTQEAEEAATLRAELRVQEALASSSSATRWRQHE
jgi:hypothetical protein